MNVDFSEYQSAEVPVVDVEFTPSSMRTTSIHPSLQNNSFGHGWSARTPDGAADFRRDAKTADGSAEFGMSAKHKPDKCSGISTSMSDLANNTKRGPTAAALVAIQQVFTTYSLETPKSLMWSYSGIVPIVVILLVCCACYFGPKGRSGNKSEAHEQVFLSGGSIPEIQGRYVWAGNKNTRFKFEKKDNVDKGKSGKVELFYGDEKTPGWWITSPGSESKTLAFNPEKVVLPPASGWRVAPSDGSTDFTEEPSIKVMLCQPRDTQALKDYPATQTCPSCNAVFAGRVVEKRDFWYCSPECFAKAVNAEGNQVQQQQPAEGFNIAG